MGEGWIGTVLMMGVWEGGGITVGVPITGLGRMTGGVAILGAGVITIGEG